MREFKNLRVWEKGMNISKASIKLYSELKELKAPFALSEQLVRSAISIPSNIAEGCSRRSDKENYRYFEIALGSSFELETQLLLTLELYDKDSDYLSNLLGDIKEEQKMLGALMKSISYK
jgi:four helix bundle protein